MLPSGRVCSKWSAMRRVVNWPVATAPSHAIDVSGETERPPCPMAWSRASLRSELAVRVLSAGRTEVPRRKKFWLMPKASCARSKSLRLILSASTAKYGLLLVLAALYKSREPPGAREAVRIPLYSPVLSSYVRSTPASTAAAVVKIFATEPGGFTSSHGGRR